jgi:hypothetical protein
MTILNAIIDISHHNGNVNLNRARDDGIIGVIQKASQGQTGRDPTYRSNRTKAEDAGLLWGAYHFATGSDGPRQAENFLETVGELNHTLLVLDFSPTPLGTGGGEGICDPCARDHGTPFIPAITSSSCWERTTIRSSPNAGSGWRNMVPRRWCRPIGPPGRCDNIPTARSGRSPTK